MARENDVRQKKMAKKLNRMRNKREKVKEWK